MSEDKLSSEDKDSSHKKKFFNRGVLIRLALVVILAASIGTAVYFKNEADKVKSDPAAVQAEKNQAETDRVMTALKRVLLVTEDAAPTVARIEDAEKLKTSNAEFYKDAQVGDYLIIFPSRAVVYRENINQIINIAPILNNTDVGTDQSAVTPTE